MAFDGVSIGISDGLPENRRFCLARCRVSGCPNLENPLGAVEMLLVPSDRKHFDSPACLATGRLSMVGLICPRNQGRYRIIKALMTVIDNAKESEKRIQARHEKTMAAFDEMLADHKEAMARPNGKAT